MALTLAQYKDRIAKKGIPELGDADTQLTYAINFARRIVWYHYNWPFKLVVSSSFNMTSASATKTVSQMDNTLKTIGRLIDTTNGKEINKTELDELLDLDPALDDVGDYLSAWCWKGSTILFYPILSSGTTIAVVAYGEKTLTELSNASDTDSDITDDDIAEAVVTIAHARALVENDNIVKEKVEYLDAIKYLNKIVQNNYENKNRSIQAPGWNIFTGKIRKR